MPINVLVVDDSAFMRRVISDMLNEDSGVNVIDTCRNGKEALEKIKVLQPDVITLDVEMPIMDGIETLGQIMKTNKIPVVMLSSLTIEGAEATLKALELGAVDFITKPNSIFDMNNDVKKDELISKIKVAAGAKLSSSTTVNYFTEKISPKKTLFKSNEHKNSTFSNLIAIGTSTGGPRALQAIIPYIDQNINAGLVVVQHMPPGFTKSLANRLNSMSQIIVKEAEDSEKVLKGYCYISPGDHHTRIVKKTSGYYIELSKDKPVSGHRPSVDVLMNSVSKLKGINLLGVILTGMGADGAKGIKEIFDENGYTIAQDEETSIIYGMPKVAVKLGGIKKVMSLNKIAYHLIEKAGV